jgi:hypothetical protein
VDRSTERLLKDKLAKDVTVTTFNSISAGKVKDEHII